MMPRVSVIVPVYNVEKYLAECLESIIGQSLTDIEIICINDGSPDNSLAVLREYAAKDARIKIIDKQNEGVGKARNDGIQAAAGEFIAFMDSDDFYPHNEVLEKLYTAAKENGVKVAGGRKIYYLPEGTYSEETYPFTQLGMQFEAYGLTKYSDFQYDYGYWQYIYSREMLVENQCFFPPYKRFQDPPFFVNAMILAGEFYAVDTLSYCYRRIITSSKYNIHNTIHFLHGMMDNLTVSKAANLPKLHFLTAERLNKEGSFMAIQNLFDENHAELLHLFIKATAAVDTEWLKAEGFPIQDPFVPEVFEYAVSSAKKYENIRQTTAGKLLSKIKK